MLLSEPAKRPAYITIGTDLSNAVLNFKAEGDLRRDWATIQLIDGRAEADALFMKQYCCNYHNEQICPKCHTFNIRGLVHCIQCKAGNQKDPTEIKGSFVSIAGQVDFTNAELRPLVYKSNSKFRGKITDPDVALRNRAKKHLKSALQKGHKSCIDRWEKDDSYRQTMQDENWTRQDIERFDHLAAEKHEEVKMPWAERQKRMQGYRWEIVQGKGGGRQTVQTSSYPEYEAKKAATPPEPSSSSSSWTRQWWSQSSNPPWRQDAWWNKRW